MEKAKIAVLIPTLNGGKLWEQALQMLAKQSIKPDVSIVADSASTDMTTDLAAQYGHHVIPIRREDFNHGGTRQYLATEAAKCDYLVYLTQDAVLADEYALENMVQMLDENPQVGAVCGRQLPHLDANPIAAFARQYNYPAKTYIRTMDDIETLGLKTIFLSNSFSGYRREALEQVGGFPKDVIFGEDMFVAAKMMQAGWYLGYAGNASVHHSHNYSLGCVDNYSPSQNKLPIIY